MILKKGEYINIQCIDFLRVIHDLPEGYQKNAYPTYIAVIKDTYFPLEEEELNSLLICLTGLRTLTYTTPERTYIGSPGNTKMTVYVNKDNIAHVHCFDLFEVSYTIKFISGTTLYVYDKDTINKISVDKI